MKRSKSALVSVPSAALAEIVELVEVARRQAARALNTVMTAAYWSSRERIVLEECCPARLLMRYAAA